MSCLYEVDPRKFRDYLLNPNHPKGGPKCRLFLRFGFKVGDPDDALLRSVLEHANTHSETGRLVKDRLTTKGIVEGPLLTPGGRTPNAVTVWQIIDADRERSITAYIR